MTVLELVSPANKTGTDHLAYVGKRQSLLRSQTNLVEIDLLRSEERLPLGQPPPGPSDYYVLISPENEFPRSGLWAFSVRDELPTVPVPLRPEDQAVALPLGDYDGAYAMHEVQEIGVRG